ncbi:short-chain dehydrogenase [Mycobacterium sp. 852002-51163_SCH5372311]|uniref:SDR family NAD(P)-dependent oxidoreductase n=1 Tax=Mycobacterium sp. 852002-51163_SCH5372311 TaxID=1834097 RepID=UPI0007FE7CD6|nr:SDR family oxidoreductase [Mycobacterium sp. 852002-51163_SCH5372311]OBF83700.1 short-chain dehydrogenase [Mycobacterium sp. 852002-51163_SCH5372311]
MKDFKDKVAIVTGGGGNGIGNALVVELAKAGAHVAFCDIANLEKTEQEIARYDVQSYSEKVDIGDKQAVTTFVDNVVATFGRIDILINNAGIALGDLAFEEASETDLEKITNINYWGVIHTTQRAYPHLLKSPEGAIANVSSTQGILAAPYLVPYCTTKFAVRGFTDSLRAEHKIRGIKNVTVHTVHPGAVATDITLNADHHGSSTATFHDHLQSKGVTPQQAAQTILTGIRKNAGRIMVSDARPQDYLARLLPTANIHVIRLMLKLKGVSPR